MLILPIVPECCSFSTGFSENNAGPRFGIQQGLQTTSKVISPEMSEIADFVVAASAEDGSGC
jgi:hypothetical protein